MKDPILITGCARSGTSMTAGILHRCGAFGGRTTDKTPWNKRGQYENTEIRENVVKPYMVLNGADPLCQWPLPDVNRLIPLTNLRQKIEGIMKWEGYKEPRHWYYKGAKMCLMWPVWHAAFPDAKWIIVRRPDEQIIESCLRTAFMRRFQDAKGWQTWVDWHKQRFREMIDNGLNVTEVWANTMVEGDISAIGSFVRENGLNWNKQAVKEFISPELWRGGNGK